MKKKLIISFAVLSLCVFTAFVILSDHDRRVADNLNLFQSVFHLLDENYVDEIDPEKLIRVGIDAMLKATDPYTAFYNEKETIERNKSWKGILYAGIGASVVKRDSGFVIAEPYGEYGAWKNDIRPGDKVIEVEGKSTKGIKLEEVVKLLRGEAGTQVNLKIEREGDILSKSVIRQEIRTKTVPYFGMIDSTVGYIKLDQFLENTSVDFTEGFQDLKKNHGCKSLVIDLRTNNGGLVDEAVKVLSVFLPEKTLVCSLRSRKKSEEKKYLTNTPPLDTLMPLVVLTSEKSVSAAEIFAACLQDIDRAVIMGAKTFGKGFVQGTRFPGYGGSLYVTAARYYTPSGRCLQQLDYSKLSEGKIISYADSSKEKFYTKTHRIVYNKGGVEPDLISAHIESDENFQGFLQSYFIFDYANAYRNSHSQIAPIKNFSPDGKVYDDFFYFLKKSNYNFETTADKQLKDLEKKLGSSPSEKKIFEKNFRQLESDLLELKKQKLLANKSRIKLFIDQEIIRRYYSARGVYEYNLHKDNEIISAAHLLLNRQKYEMVLNPG